MTQVRPQPTGFLTLTLHAHLPYVVNHGTWPHGIEWLHEAAAETYLPLLRMLRNLERDGIPFRCNLNLTPILLEQLAHPVFVAEFPRYLQRKIVAAQEDEAFFVQSGETHYAELARFWRRFFAEALADFQALNCSIVSGFRHFSETGHISIITCAATHGYLPLLGTDESVRAQIRVGVETHIRHLGVHPRGIWSPECGYRPAGPWTYPVGNADGSPPPPAFDRIGTEQAISESGLGFFFVDTHLVEEAYPIASPYSDHTARLPAHFETDRDGARLYHPHLLQSTTASPQPVAIFPRDPRTGIQVWSGDMGYPGEAAYLDFHKKRWPGGHRYWRVTGAHIGLGDKQPYYPQDAAQKVEAHAAHFVYLVRDVLAANDHTAAPPVLCAPFDAELFGHWWFEGCFWLEAVARKLHATDLGVQLISCAEYLERFPAADPISMHEGSWGAAGGNQVWLNPETAWTWSYIYPAELYTREVATHGRWRQSELGTRIIQQLCRELLLLESSDWQFLITTGAARDYAESRFVTHNDQFHELASMSQAFDANGFLSLEHQARLHEIETRDSIFPDLDPALWSTGAHATPTPAPPPT